MPTTEYIHKLKEGELKFLKELIGKHIWSINSDSLSIHTSIPHMYRFHKEIKLVVGGERESNQIYCLKYSFVDTKIGDDFITLNIERSPPSRIAPNAIIRFDRFIIHKIEVYGDSFSNYRSKKSAWYPEDYTEIVSTEHLIIIEAKDGRRIGIESYPQTEINVTLNEELIREFLKRLATPSDTAPHLKHVFQ